MKPLPLSLYDAPGTRALDAAAIQGHGVPGYELMRRAAAFAYRTLRGRWPGVRRVRVCCGRGNNGGDGYIVAELCARDGLDVELLACAEPAWSGRHRVRPRK